MSALDLKKEQKQLYNSSASVASIVDVPPMLFAMVDGAGDPNTAQEYRDAVEALYALSYAVKFKLKKSGGEDFVVMPLEGLWWVDDYSQFSFTNRDNWKWTMLIRQPVVVTLDLFPQVVQEVTEKKKRVALNKLRMEQFGEGRAAQIIHIGPYATEAQTIDKLHRFIKDAGYQLRGKHHEIYLSDPRKSAPEKMRTILRQPVG